MCIHYLQAKYTCGCIRTLPTSGPGYTPPRWCASVKTAHKHYHAQPRYLPLPQSLPAPKPCPLVIDANTTGPPADIALLISNKVCPVHTDLVRLCQLSEDKRAASHHGWREVTGDKTSIGEFQGEDGCFKGVECFTVTNTSKLPAADVSPVQVKKKTKKKVTFGATEIFHMDDASSEIGSEDEDGTGIGVGSGTESAEDPPEVSSSSSLLPAQQVQFLTGLLYASQTLEEFQASVGRKRSMSL